MCVCVHCEYVCMRYIIFINLLSITPIYKIYLRNLLTMRLRITFILYNKTIGYIIFNICNIYRILRLPL